MTFKKFKKNSLLILGLVFTTSNLAFAGEGFDSGLHTRCIWTGPKIDELTGKKLKRSYADFTDCPSLNPYATQWNQTAWFVGSNSPMENGFCGGKNTRMSYPLNKRSSPLRLKWLGNSAEGYTLEMGIVKDPCSAKAEISYAIGNPTSLPVKGLNSHFEIALKKKGGIYHVESLIYIRTPQGKHTLNLTFIPTSLRDSRLHRNQNGILFHGSPVNRKGERGNLVVLDASHFGFPNLCPNKKCGDFVSIDINWETLISEVQKRGLWKDLGPLDQLFTSVTYELQTFGSGGRVSTQIRNFKQWNAN